MQVFHWSRPYDSRLQKSGRGGGGGGGSGTKIHKKGRKNTESVAPPQQDGTLTDRTWWLPRQGVGSGTFIARPVVEVLRQALNPNRQAVAGLDKVYWQTDRTGEIDRITPTRCAVGIVSTVFDEFLGKKRIKCQLYFFLILIIVFRFLL